MRDITYIVHSDDDQTPPPAAPAIQQQVEEPAATFEPWAFSVVEEVDTNPTTQDTTIPVSVFADDYKELEWKFAPAEELLEKWDHFKSHAPYLARTKEILWVKITNASKIANFHPWDDDIDLTQERIDELNKWIWVDKLPVVSIKENWEWHNYSMIWIGDADITDLNWWIDMWQNRHVEFKSMILVDFAAWEKIEKKIQNTIRPSKFQKDDLGKYKYCYYENNVAYQITKDWKPIDQNRVLSFTREEWYDKDWNQTNQWYLSTLLQVERLAPNDQSLAFKNKRVFLAAPKANKVIEWWLYRWWKDNDFKVKYDSRPVFTTSDLVFNPDNTDIMINGLNISIKDRSYDQVLNTEWWMMNLKWKQTDDKTLQEWFNFLWKKWQTMTDDWFAWEEVEWETVNTSEQINQIVEDMPDPVSINEAEKEFKEIVQAQNDNVEMVTEMARNTPAESTESTEETIIKQTEWVQKTINLQYTSYVPTIADYINNPDEWLKVATNTEENKLEYVHQTSWGMTTRLIGAIIMVHGDNNGLVLPPMVAPTQVVIVPIRQNQEGVLDKAYEVKSALSNFRVKVDDSDKSPGWKFSESEMRGIPVRIELGPKDIEAGQAVLVRRDTHEKITVALAEIEEKVAELLETIQKDMLERARQHREEHTFDAHNMEEIYFCAKPL